MNGAGLSLILGALALVLAILLQRQWRQGQRLRHWLDDPEQRERPEATGMWQDIYARLGRWRRQAQKERSALNASLEHFRLAAQALPDGVIMLDGQGRIEWLNAMACRHFGLDAERDIGARVEPLIRASGFHEWLAASRAGGQAASLRLETGSTAPPRVLSLLPLSFAIDGLLLLSHDITEITRTEAMRRDFIANVSHELRTPLTVIAGFSEQLTAAEAPTGDAAKPYLALIAEQAERMGRLVEDLLTLSRLENDSAPLREDTVDVPALVATLCAEARALAAGRLEIECSAATAGSVRGNADELRSAFGNLVSNAVRYTPAGGRVTLGWQLDAAGCPVFAVTDTGIGIAAAHIPRLTERFYRVDKGRSAASGGTGLGLAIVKHVLARHQATLSIRSEVGRGSEFAVRLPRARRVE